MKTEINENVGIRCNIKLPSRNRVAKDTNLDPYFATEFVDLIRADTAAVTGDRYIVNSDTRKKLGSVSAGYNLFTHKQASDTVREFLDTTGIPYEPMHVGTSTAGARYFESIKFPSLEFNASTGIPSTALDNKGLVKDTFVPVLNIRNSYDKSSGISWVYGLYRVVCANGMAILSYEQKLSFRHNEVLNQSAVRENLLFNLENTVKIMETTYNRLNIEGGNKYLNKLLTTSFSDRFKYMVLDAAKGHYEMDSSIDEDENGKTLKINGISTLLSAYSVYNILTEVSTHKITNLSEKSAIDEKIASIFNIVA